MRIQMDKFGKYLKWILSDDLHVMDLLSGVQVSAHFNKSKVFNFEISVHIPNLQICNCHKIPTQQFPNNYIDMINGIKPSEAAIINKNKTNHLKRLHKINTSKSKSFRLDTDFMGMVNQRKYNHERRMQFNRQQQEYKLFQKNEKLFDKIMDMTLKKGPYSTQLRVNQTQYRHHNSKVVNLKKMKMLDEQNPQIAKRIMERTGDLSHIKDLKNFQRNRQIMNRLQKFKSVDKMINFRCKTLPARKLKIDQPSNDEPSLIIENN